MESPLMYNDLEDEQLKSQFKGLLDSIVRNNVESEEELTECIRLEVTANPTLSRITYRGGMSILWAILDQRRQLGAEQSHSIIKFMIQMNPSALIWNDFGSVPISTIAQDDLHCILMPWIATNYSWVLDDDQGEQSVFNLIHMFASRECTAETIQQFFEAYPQALELRNNRDDISPLHAILHHANCDVDLFKWMAQRYPNNRLAMDESGCLIQGALLNINKDGMTLLHTACKCLAIYNGDNMRTICKYLIDRCPRLTQSLTHRGKLPIHYLLKSHSSINHPLVREVIVCLLREYPESYRMAVRSLLVVRGRVIDPPSDYPFVRHIKPLLDQEKKLMESANQLQVMSSTLSTAVSCTNDELVRSTDDVFNSWATSFAQSLDNKVKDISTQLDHACVHFDNNTTAE